jgi:hypothetical protein
MHNGSNGTYADRCDGGPHVFNNSLDGLIVTTNFSLCVQTVDPIGYMLTGVTVALTCLIIRLLV